MSKTLYYDADGRDVTERLMSVMRIESLAGSSRAETLVFVNGQPCTEALLRVYVAKCAFCETWLREQAFSPSVMADHVPAERYQESFARAKATSEKVPFSVGHELSLRMADSGISHAVLVCESCARTKTVLDLIEHLHGGRDARGH